MNSPAGFQSRKDALKHRMERLGISESDFKESFARSSGPGGQNVNKVSTAVTLRYPPAAISVTVQESRSQAQNRQIARERLVTALEERVRAKKNAARSAAAKRRRQHARRPRALKERILESKKRRSQLKKLRSNPVE